MKVTLRNRRGKEHPSWRGCGVVSHSYFGVARGGAERRAIEFSITIDYLNAVAEAQGRSCVLSGRELYWSRATEEGMTASLDRIDSSIGYVPGNVQWIHKHINKMKWDIPQGRFIKLCRLIHELPFVDIQPLQFPIECNRQNHHMWSGCGFLGGKQWGDIARACVRPWKTVPMLMSIEDGWRLYVAQGGRCRVSGIPIHFNLEGRGGSGTASLDRIDSSGGYSVGNVQWVHIDVNTIKYSYDMEYFLEMCSLIGGRHPVDVQNLLQPTQLWFNSFSDSMSSLKRSATQRSKPSHVDSTSRYKGVSWNRRDRNWHARLVSDNRCIYEQTFQDEVQAAHHWDFFAIKYLGARAGYLNFPNFDYRAFSPLSPGQRGVRRLGRKSRFKGVAPATAKGKKWRTVLCLGMKSKPRTRTLGQFDTEEEAAENYDYHALRIRGPGATLNFPDRDYSGFVPAVPATMEAA